MTKVYLVPKGTEVPEVLNLDEIENDNIFLLIADCAEAPDGGAFIGVTDGELDFLAKNRLQLPFDPVLLTKIPGVKYSQFFLLCQSTFDSESYDTIESGRRQEATERKEEVEAIDRELTRKSTFKPPRPARTHMTESAIEDDDVVVEEP